MPTHKSFFLVATLAPMLLTTVILLNKPVNRYRGTPKNSDFVIPAKAGIQFLNRLDTGLRRRDEFLEVPTGHSWRAFIA